VCAYKFCSYRIFHRLQQLIEMGTVHLARCSAELGRHLWTQGFQPTGRQFLSDFKRSSPCCVPGPLSEQAPRGETSICLRIFQCSVGTPPYFSSHFNSSRTLIFPCQGFLPRPWPSPGKINSLFGTPSEYSACSRR